MTLHLPTAENDGAGGTRLTTVEVEQHLTVVEPGVPPLLATHPIPTQSVLFVDVLEDISEVPPHPAGARQLVVILSGVCEIALANGDTYQFGPGQVILAADTHGGHISRILQHPCRIMFVILSDEQADPD
jgi:hypothetical protein